MIQLKGICKSYPRPDEGPLEVLRNIEININEGDYIAIVGPSGSGKSTLMNILGLLDHADSGEYLMDGENVSGLSSAKLANLRNQKIGFVFQQFHLLPRTTAIENVEIPLVYSNADNAEQRAIDALKSVGLGDRMKHMPEELSGGQQQRTAVARAIFKDSSTFFGDEPVSAVDEHQSHTVMEAIAISHRTVVLSMHDVELALKYSSRVIGLKEGELALDEPADRLKAADLDDLYKS